MLFGLSHNLWFSWNFLMISDRDNIYQQVFLFTYWGVMLEIIKKTTQLPVHKIDRQFLICFSSFIVLLMVLALNNSSLETPNMILY